jgi:hypothetical protein
LQSLGGTDFDAKAAKRAFAEIDDVIRCGLGTLLFHFDTLHLNYAAGAGFLTTQADDTFMRACIFEYLQLNVPAISRRKRDFLARILNGHQWLEQPPHGNRHPFDQTESANEYFFEIAHF